MKKSILAVAALLSLAAPALAQAEWTPRTSGTENDLHAVAWNGSLFVAVGQSGTVRTSPDGVTWTTRTVSENPDLYAVAWNGSRFVAVGLSGAICTSPDGITWDAQTLGGNPNFNAVAWNGNLFVAVGTGGIRTSPDGVTWTTRTVGGSPFLIAVAWNGSRFVAVGLSGAIRTSPDGVTWSAQTLGGNPFLFAVAWNGSFFLAGGGGGGGGDAVYTSPDGVTWNEQTTNGNSQFYAITWNGNLFVAVAYDGAVRTSPDGVTWIEQAATGATLRSIAWGDGRLVAVGEDGVILTSDPVSPPAPPANLAYAAETLLLSPGVDTTFVPALDGGPAALWLVTPPLPAGLSLDPVTGAIRGALAANTPAASYTVSARNVGGSATRVLNIATPWVTRTSNTTSDFRSVAWNGSRFVAVGRSGAVSTSPDGVTWDGQTLSGDPVLLAVAWNGSRFVAVGSGGAVRTSPDGVTWDGQTLSGSPFLRSIAWNGSLLVAVGNNTIRTSPDGVTWTTRTVGGDPTLEAVAWSGTQFVAVGWLGAVRTSPDGVTWTTRTMNGNPSLRSVAWNGSLLVAVGNNTIRTSPDGVTWTTQTVSGNPPLDAIAWNGSRFVAVGWNGSAGTSPDGVAWTMHSSGTEGKSLYSVAWGDGRLVAVGENGTILTSDPVSLPAPPANLAYAAEILVVPPGSDTTLVPALGGGPAARWFVTPPLPEGLSLDPVTGVIRGAPTEEAPMAAYTVSARNIGGSATRVLNIAVSSWIARTSNTTNNLRSVAWNGSLFAAVGADGVRTSPDGVAWTTQTVSGDQNLFAVTWNGSRFAAVGAGGTVLSSPDGVAWDEQTMSGNPELNAVAWNGNLFVAVGDDGAVRTSPDGVAWEEQTVSGNPTLNAVAWNGSRFVAVGSNGAVRTSPDGVAWTTQTTSGTLRSVAWNGSLFTAVGSNGTVGTSPDGAAWTTQTLGGIPQLFAVAWNGSFFTAVGNNGTVRTSPDGTAWTTQTSGTTNSLLSVTWGNGRLVAVGQNGTILTHDPESLPAPPANLAYAADVLVLTTNVDSTFVPTFTGNAARWFVTPPLPEGLAFDPVTGVIRGAPAAPASTATYTVSARNIGGSAARTLNIAVITPGAPAIAYPGGPFSFPLGVPIVNLRPVKGGGPATSYSIDKDITALTGLQFNTNTGILSGKPAVATGGETFTITAHGAGGATGATEVTISTTGPTLSYTGGPFTFPLGVPIVNLRPVKGAAAITGYAIDKDITALTGLQFNTNTGILSGKPAVAIDGEAFTITAHGLDGTFGTTELTITTTGPTVSYTGGSFTFPLGVAIEPLRPVKGLAAITGYAIDKDITALTGLQFNTNTGILSGKPAVAIDGEAFTITAHGLDGTFGTTEVILTTTGPTLSYTGAPFTFPLGVPIEPLRPVKGLAAITGYAIDKDITALTGLQFNTNTGILSGKPAVAIDGEAFTITAHGLNGTFGTTELTITTQGLPPILAYAGDGQYDFPLGSPITPLRPIKGGGPIVNYSIAPPDITTRTRNLSGGLQFNAQTGILSGTPTRLLEGEDAEAFTVTAHGLGGVAGTFDITVNTHSTGKPGAGSPLVFRVSGSSMSYTFQMGGTAELEAVTMRIADMSGRMVWSRTVNPSKDGATGITWDGRAHNGVKAPAGMYIVHVAARADGKTSRVVRKTVTLDAD